MPAEHSEATLGIRRTSATRATLAIDAVSTPRHRRDRTARLAKRTIVLTAIGVLLPAVASAAGPPVLVEAGQFRMHPQAAFQAAGADTVFVKIATSPAQATSGDFLDENTVATVDLTDDEIQAGRWLHTSILDPGNYWMMLRAFDFACPEEPCIDGRSAVLPFTVPTPAQRYRTSVQVLRNLRVVWLALNVRPLGERQTYEVCWRTRQRRERCVTSRVTGHSWTDRDGATDMVRIRLRNLARRTTFRWYVDGDRVATRTVRT